MRCRLRTRGDSVCLISRLGAGVVRLTGGCPTVRNATTERGGEMFIRFVSAWLVISAVAAYGVFLTVKHSSVMNDVEINPVGLWVLRSDQGVPLLVALKAAGLGVAMLFSFALWQSEKLRRKVVGCSCFVAGL